jgi:hypothetical protein
MNTQTNVAAFVASTQTTDFVEISFDLIEQVGGGDATSYPVGPKS